VWPTPVPYERKHAVATLNPGPKGDVLVSVVCEDVDVCRNVPFDYVDNALVYLKRTYNTRFRVLCNIHPNARRMGS
jgi:hypothetical protein